MKLLKCKICAGEVDIVGNESGIHKKVKCRRCNWSNLQNAERQEPEIVIIRKRPGSNQ